MPLVQIASWSDLQTWAPPGGDIGGGDWPLAPLAEVLTLITPIAYVPAEGEVVRFAGVRWYGNGVYVREERTRDQISAKCYRLVPGALVYNRLFGWKSAFDIVSDELDGVVVSNEFPQFEVDESRAVPMFVKLVCGSPAFARIMLARSTGSTAVSRNRLHAADLLDLAIPLPDLTSQGEIVAQFATRLAKADQLADSATKRRAAATNAFARGIGSAPPPQVLAGSMVSVARFANLSRWDSESTNGPLSLVHPVSTLDQHAEVRLGCQIPKRGANPGGVERPYLRAANVQRGSVDLADVKTMRVSTALAEALTLQPDDLLFLEGSGSVAEVGRCAVWHGEVPEAIHQNSVVRARITDDALDPQFAAAWFNSEMGSAYFKDQATTTSGLYHIGAGKTAKAPVPLPPVDAQRELAASFWSATAFADESDREARALRSDAIRYFALTVFGEEAEATDLDDQAVENSALADP